MKVFFDTSTLFKRFIENKNSDVIDGLFLEASEIVVSPITLTEMLVTGRRYLTEKKWTEKEYEIYCREVKDEFKDYTEVIFNDALKNLISGVVNKFPLKSLDVIQLSSGKLSRSNLFVTSDKQLYQKVKSVMPARFIE